MVYTGDFDSADAAFHALDVLKLSTQAPVHRVTPLGNRVKIYTPDRAAAIFEDAKAFETRKAEVAQENYDAYKANLKLRADLEDRGQVIFTPQNVLASKALRQTKAMELAKGGEFTVSDYQKALSAEFLKLGNVAYSTALNDLDGLLEEYFVQRLVSKHEALVNMGFDQEKAVRLTLEAIENKLRIALQEITQ